MKRFVTGLVVGKFAPLHLGHEHVIRAALAACDHVVLLSYSRPEFPGCGPERRAAWLASRFPETTRIVLDPASEPLPHNDETDDIHRAFCASVLARHAAPPIDAIFSSEGYGAGFAADLARRQGGPVAHVAVDPDRRTVAISGTELRADLHGLRHFLAPGVYTSFVERVALLGGESTGKSTLAAALADALGTRHVAEFGRELWERKGGLLGFGDLLAIANEQIRREEEALVDPRTNRFLICDTTPLTTLFYSLEMFGRADPRLCELARRPYHHWLLCADDFPFRQDGTRRDPGFRSKGQRWYRQQLTVHPHTLVTGDIGDRIRQARAALEGG